LTLIDEYVLSTFAYFGIIGAEIAMIDWHSDMNWPDRTLVDFGSGAVDSASEEAEEASYRATWANILLWATLHVGMVVRAWYLIHQHEGTRRRYYRMRSKRRKRTNCC